MFNFRYRYWFTCVFKTNTNPLSPIHMGRQILSLWTFKQKSLKSYIVLLTSIILYHQRWHNVFLICIQYFLNVSRRFTNIIYINTKWPFWTYPASKTLHYTIYKWFSPYLDSNPYIETWNLKFWWMVYFLTVYAVVIKYQQK